MDLIMIVPILQKMANEIIKKNQVPGDVVRDSVFDILEKNCTVVYYPLHDENCGFHIKRFINETEYDFVYINTDKKYAEQVFAAAHELGHVKNVVEKVAEEVGEVKELSEVESEDIINRFAAELLMPCDIFKSSFLSFYNELNKENRILKIDEILLLMVKQMNEYMVPYEAVRRRMVETQIIDDTTAEILKEENIQTYVDALSSELNTMLDVKTQKKTIPGLRSKLEYAERNNLVDEYTIKKIKNEFEFKDVENNDKVVTISLGGSPNE